MPTIRDLLNRLRQALTPPRTITDDDVEYKSIIEAAGREAADSLDEAGIPRQIGWTETFVETKKQILREKYGLRWKPPKE